MDKKEFNEMVVNYINNLTVDKLVWTGNPVLVFSQGEVKVIDQDNMSKDDVELLDVNLDWTPAKRYLPSNNYGDFILSNHHLGYIKDKFMADWNANKQ